MKDYVVHPDSYLHGAVMHGLLDISEIDDSARREAEACAERLCEYFPEGEGFGSSDMAYELQSFLNHLGYPVTFVDNKLTRLQGPRNRY